MACRGCLECILKLLNFLLTLLGLAMVAYGIYLLVEYNKVSGDTLTASSVDKDNGLIQLGRPILMAVSLSASSIFDNLPKAWYGTMATVYILIYWNRGDSLRHLMFWMYWNCNTEWLLLELCILTNFYFCFYFFIFNMKYPNICYSVLVVLLILVEVGCAAFIFFDKSWQSEIPTDKTGDFDMIYAFLKEHWNIVRWVVLGAVILEALLFVIALMVRAANKPPEYDSDDEFIAPRQQIRQPLINRPAVPATGVPVAGTLDQRPSRNDAWSTRMREKIFVENEAKGSNQNLTIVQLNVCVRQAIAHIRYGLDTSEFTYNPNESHRFQQVGTQPAEERRRCTIM
ncbi:hypothetical protein FEM48_Zijuj11G0080500 [Ziziphus jujuba var. spinosa]|uniref:Tobamovirus multiplication protein 2A n=1 Tax=Ziziphus jujuba var. spinosa TaxID=714518 RepID=A0A978UHS4_ZIZJJ|nr:hypothetical protein FEM48_Zijuj11G0080500 [Ziziphus jujuba var. spinosa]